ncbi:MAG: hypothetical protein ACKVPX_16335 [Myxococcaceae bacterium]
MRLELVFKCIVGVALFPWLLACPAPDYSIGIKHSASMHEGFDSQCIGEALKRVPTGDFSFARHQDAWVSKTGISLVGTEQKGEMWIQQLSSPKDRARDLVVSFEHVWGTKVDSSGGSSKQWEAAEKITRNVLMQVLAGCARGKLVTVQCTRYGTTSSKHDCALYLEREHVTP